MESEMSRSENAFTMKPPEGIASKRCGEQLAVRPLDRDGRYGIFFASWQVGSIHLTRSQTVSDVSEQASAMSPV
jgi:hypothetical protein